MAQDWAPYSRQRDWWRASLSRRHAVSASCDADEMDVMGWWCWQLRRRCLGRPALPCAYWHAAQPASSLAPLAALCLCCGARVRSAACSNPEGNQGRFYLRLISLRHRRLEISGVHKRDQNGRGLRRDAENCRRWNEGFQWRLERLPCSRQRAGFTVNLQLKHQKTKPRQCYEQRGSRRIDPNPYICPNYPNYP